MKIISPYFCNIVTVEINPQMSIKLFLIDLRNICYESIHKSDNNNNDDDQLLHSIVTSNIIY